ncbi:unnamed protein product [Leptidea sinapis]|uniref:Uncharacterized protein n=1 Tax=Leptidea sinapis TaxID=189913 RepID=A0A5E4PP20_9NEOP|nr:unnamed protein product [Leptidea sinapis]
MIIISRNTTVGKRAKRESEPPDGRYLFGSSFRSQDSPVKILYGQRHVSKYVELLHRYQLKQHFDT